METWRVKNPSEGDGRDPDEGLTMDETLFGNKFKEQHAHLKHRKNLEIKNPSATTLSQTAWGEEEEENEAKGEILVIFLHLGTHPPYKTSQGWHHTKDNRKYPGVQC